LPAAHPGREQAFLGFRNPAAGIKGDTEALQYQTTIGFFLELWQEEFPLEECVAVSSKMGRPGPPYDLDGLIDIKFPLGAGRNKVLTTLYPSPGNKQIYGCPWINRIGALPPPP
jgi:hypothetical protein